MVLKSDTIGRILLSRYIICTHSRRNKDILLAALHRARRPQHRWKNDAVPLWNKELRIPANQVVQEHNFFSGWYSNGCKENGTDEIVILFRRRNNERRRILRRNWSTRDKLRYFHIQNNRFNSVPLHEQVIIGSFIC